MKSWRSLLLAVPVLGTALLTGAGAVAVTHAATAPAHPAVATTLRPTYHLAFK